MASTAAGRIGLRQLTSPRRLPSPPAFFSTSPLPRITRPISRTYFSNSIPNLSHPPTPQSLSRHSFFTQRLTPPRRPLTTSAPRRTTTTVSPNPSTTPPPPPPRESISSKLKSLSREYGYAAVAIYFALSLLDLPISFLLVRLLGPERIATYEHHALGFLHRHLPQAVFDGINAVKDGIKAVIPWGGKAAEEEEGEGNKVVGKPSIWTELALAYAIHKSVFIFVRVPLTAAVTPKVVKVLRGWGWNIGKKGGVKAAAKDVVARGKGV